MEAEGRTPGAAGLISEWVSQATAASQSSLFSKSTSQVSKLPTKIIPFCSSQ